MKQILTLVFLCTVLCLQAQPASEPTLEQLSAKVEQLEKKTSTWDKILAHMPRVSGYLQAGYEWSETSSNFMVKRACLNLVGDLGHPKVDYQVQFDFAALKLLDAYVQYRPFTQLNFKLGEYKVPFSIENTDYSPTRLELIEYPMVIRHLVGFDDMCGVAAAGRDIGFTVWGGFGKRDGYSIVNYDLGVFNGDGINIKDVNKTKDIVARLTLKPVAGLQISGSYYWGEAGADYRKRTRYGAGACYDRGWAMLRGEYIAGTTGMVQSDTSVANVDSDGWYVTGGWRATRSLMPLLRYDTFTRDAAQRSETHQTNYTAGLLWTPVKFLRCQLNYTYEQYAAASATNRNVVAVMLTGMF